MRRALSVLSVLSVLLLAGCGSTATNSDPLISPAATSSSQTATATVAAATSATAATRRPHHVVKLTTVLGVAKTNYGRALVDRRGFALYLFTRDPAHTTKCEGACAATWPPYIIKGEHVAAQLEAHTALVGTIRRPDGHLQVTYRGHPLYYYVGDRQPHEVLCQAVAEFGGTWYVVTPGGNAIR